MAEKYKINILQPEILANYKLQITNYKPDFFIVAAYGQILPKEILEIPRFGTIGVHPSLLPKYRGPSPIQTAILSGDEITGVTLYLMDERIDSGPILAKRELENYELGIMNYEKLHNKLAELGADLLIEFLRKYENLRKYEKITGVSQDESQATYTKKFKTEDAFIESQDLEKAQNGSAGSSQVAAEIDRKIRALNPEPGTFTLSLSKGGLSKRMKILEAILTADGKLKLKKIQYEGKKPVEI